MTKVLRASAWIALLVGVIVGFTALGSGRLGGLAVTEPASWAAWAAARAPVEALFGVLRAAVLGLAWYLLAVSVLGMVARLARVPRLVAAVDLVTLPVVRRMLQAAVGLSLAGSSLAINVAAVGAQEQPAAVGAQEQPAAVGAQEQPAAVGAQEQPAAVGEVETSTVRWSSRVTTRDIRGPAPAPPAAVPWVTRDPVPVPAPTAVAAPPSAEREWTVEPGQHFWSIAEQVLREAWGRPPQDDEVEPYWRALVEENRSALADPDNPDLVYPGQVFTVPAPPAG